MLRVFNSGTTVTVENQTDKKKMDHEMEDEVQTGVIIIS